MSDEPSNPPSDPHGRPYGGDDPAGPPTSPYGQAPQAPQPPYSANPYGDASQNPYDPNPYGQAPHGQAPYGQQPGYAYAGPVAPPHPSATTSLVLGIIGLAGILFCGGITLVLSPFAWAMGSKAVREIDANPGAYSGREQAKGGQVMGIIGTVLLVLGVLLVGAAIVLFFGAVSGTESVTFDSGTSFDDGSSF